MAAEGGFLGRFTHGWMLCKCAGSALALLLESRGRRLGFRGGWGLGLQGCRELYSGHVAGFKVLRSRLTASGREIPGVSCCRLKRPGTAV